jgi:hypothetical protein
LSEWVLIKVLIFLAGGRYAAVTNSKDELCFLLHIVGGHLIYARLGKLWADIQNIA